MSCADIHVAIRLLLCRCSDLCWCRKVAFIVPVRSLHVFYVHSANHRSKPFGQSTRGMHRRSFIEQGIRLLITRLCIVCLPVSSTVRECRGAQAIGRDSREKNVTKFDLQWKNLLISHIVSGGQLTQKNDEDTESREAHGFPQAQSYTFL
jgi:hypothetical protein